MNSFQKIKLTLADKKHEESSVAGPSSETSWKKNTAKKSPSKPINLDKPQTLVKFYSLYPCGFNLLLQVYNYMIAFQKMELTSPDKTCVAGSSSAHELSSVAGPSSESYWRKAEIVPKIEYKRIFSAI